jgi:hypothetical protein
MKLQIKVDDEGNIVDSRFTTFGCGSAIASSSVATEWVKGKSLEEVRGRAAGACAGRAAGLPHADKRRPPPPPFHPPPPAPNSSPPTRRRCCPSRTPTSPST